MPPSIVFRPAASPAPPTSWGVSSPNSVINNRAYLDVSSRGNFFLRWEPGQDFWIPHNRGTPRRIQNIGFVRGDIKNGLWMKFNGGKLLVSPSSVDLDSEEFPFEEANNKTGGYGITDVAWRNENEVKAVGEFFTHPPPSPCDMPPLSAKSTALCH